MDQSGGDRISQPASPSPVSTWNVLRAIGFTEIDGCRLCFDFGNFQLEAVQGITLLAVPVVQISGVLSSDRIIAMVSHDLPSELESYEQGLAFLTYYLRRHVRHLSRVPDWLHEGTHYQHLLPWERERAAYRARPHCLVQREWLRVALKTLAKRLATVSDDAAVTFQFDGGVLTIRCAGKPIAMAGEGDPWPRSYAVEAGSIRKLPTRLMQENVEISIWERSLVVGNRRYSVLDELT